MRKMGLGSDDDDPQAYSVELGGHNASGMPPLYCLSNQTKNGSCDAPQCPTGNCSNGTSGVENPYILVWYLQLVYIIVFVSMVLVAAGGNIIVIWIVMAHKRMRTVTNYFLVNLAVADALISILNTLFNFIYMLYSDWPFGRTYCKFTQFIAPCTISASVFTFMAIAIDRYMAIIHPLNPRMKAQVVLCVIAAIWMVSILIAFPNLIYAEIHTWEYENGDTRTLCYLNWPDGVYQATDFAYNIFIMLVNYVAPIVALGVTYTRVGLELWGSQAIGERTSRQEDSVKSKRRVVKMMIVVVIIFGVCWLPQHVFFLVSNKYPSINEYKNVQHVYLAIYWLAMSNSMYNPIIYCWMNARFRNGFMYVFRWLPCVKYDANDSVVRTTFHSVRMSVSDTKYTAYGYGRNGSMMHTVVESMGDSSTNSSNVNSGTYHKAHWDHVKRNNFPPLKEDTEREASV